MDKWWKQVKARRGDGTYHPDDYDEMQENELSAAFKAL